MGNVVNLPNITPEVIADLEKNQQPQTNNKFNTKNYLNTKLEDGEKEKTITIRLLPMDLQTGNPFVKIHVHNVRVPKEMVDKGQKPYKTYLCLSKNEGIDHEHFGTKCPFCELNKSAYDKSKEESDEVLKKTYQDISLANKSNEAYVVRCIERGHEEDGVKFWKFNTRFDNKDPYHTIINLYNKRKEEAEKKGKKENILDIYEGYDLNITFNAGNPVPPPTIIDEKDSSPLSEDEELMRKWIYDDKKWTEVFTPKSYEFLQLVSEMKVPWYDKNKKKWVDKEEYEAEHGKQVQERKEEEELIDAKIKQAEQKIAANEVQNPVANKSRIVVGEGPNEDLPF